MPDKSTQTTDPAIEALKSTDPAMALMLEELVKIRAELEEKKGIYEELKEIRKEVAKNAKVAEQFGEKGEAIFNVVDKMSYVLSSPFRFLKAGKRSSPPALLEDTQIESK